MADHIVGRENELRAARAALAGNGVVLDGPAGIGKTTLWRHLVDEVQAGGSPVLRAEPSDAESALPYAALADVLRSETDALAGLPSAQAAAADVVLTGEPGHRVEERTVAAMALSVLAAACAGTDRPVLAIDDCQWLDAPSERALRYALRRLRPGPRLVLAQRGATDDPLPLGLDGDNVERITVPPLGIGAMHHVLREQLGITFSRPLLTRVTVEAEGNPLLAIELARAIGRLPALPAAGEDLPPARSIQELVARRAGALPERSLTALRLVSLLSAPNAADLRAAGVDPADLDSAEEVGLLEVRGDPRFRHPVQASAVRSRIPNGLKRRMQLRLAGAVADPDERARLLARAIIDPDEAVAVDLEESGMRQWAKGLPSLAADLLDRSAALTPTGHRPPRARRLLAALRARHDSGDHAATAAAAQHLSDTMVGNDKAEALLIGAVVAFATEGHPPALRMATEALTHADPAGPTAGRIHLHLAVFDDRPDRAAEHAATALSQIPRVDDPDDGDMRCSALLLMFYNEVRAGRPPRADLLDEALRLEGERPPWLAGSIPGLWWTAVDEHARARDRMQRQLAHARATGDEPLQLEVLLHLVQSLMLDGRWDSAEDCLEQARELGEQLGGGLDEQDYLQAQIGIYRGDLDRFRPAVTAGLERARRDEDSWGQRVYGVLDAQLALYSGQHRLAARRYGELARSLSSHGVVEPLALRWEPEWIEACVGAGDLDAARTVLEELGTRHRRLPRPWTTLGLARSRVLVDAARGSGTGSALADLDLALREVPEHVLPLDRARCLLVAGLAHRRARRRARARELLVAALAGFEAVGASAFADRTRAELDRSGLRGDRGELTATEHRVAILAARGRTNRAIAEELFISPKTVEANLARAYRKLDIASRAELGALFAGATVGSAARGAASRTGATEPRT